MSDGSLAQRLAQLSPEQRAQLSSRLRGSAARSGPTPIPVLDRAAGPLPMSSAQRRLYFLQKLRPDSAAYNNVEALALHGRLDLGALQAAVAAVLARHEVLRTTCLDDDGQPRLLAAHPAEAAQRSRLQVVDVSPPAPPGTLDEVLAAAADRPFDLDAELPLRVLLARVGDDEHVLLLVVHHVASDAWSCRLLVEELFAAYARALSGEPEPAPPAVQYADFAAWRSAAARGEQAGHLAYWRERLSGLAPVLELPLEQPRPVSRRDRGAELHFELDGQVRVRLHAAARDAAVTPFAILLTAFGHVLHRHCATDDVAVGIPVSGRDRVDVEQLIGCFINTVVLRLDLSPQPTRRDLVHRLWHSTLRDLEHQSLPFEHLVAALNPQRDLSAGQLVQVMFNHYPATEAPARVPGLRVSPFDVSRARAKFDLTATVVDHGDRLRLTVNYATDLFDAPTARRIGEHTVAVLGALLDDLDAPMATLPPVPPGDSVPRPGRAAPAEPVPVLRRFAAHALAHPDRIAVQSPAERLTYRDLDARADALAAYLSGHGSGAQPVALLFERSVDYVVALLAALKAGRTYLPLDPVMPTAHLAAVLHAADARLLLTHDAVDAAELARAVPGVTVTAVEQLPPAGPADSRPAGADLDEAMYVLFTSGSTGAPKGVVVEHRHFSAYLNSIIDRMALPDGLSFALVSTLAADLGLTNVYGALATGGTLHLLPYEWAADPPRFAEYFRAHRIDVMKLVPSHLQAVADAGLLPDVMPSRHLVLAGEACGWDLVAAARAARPGCAVWNQYGPTETTVSVLAYRVPEQPPTRRGVTVPLGFPLDHVGVHVVDAQLRPVPRGAAGELLITGGSVARGYLGSDDSRRFLADPFDADPLARAYRTGDRVRVRADGSVEFLGRLDRQVKIRGYRVEPAHVEAVLRRHPAVADAAVTARTDDGRTYLAAYYVPAAAGAAEPPLLEFARAALPPYLVPGAFVALDRLPLTPNGKLDWRALPAPERRPPGAEPGVPARHARDAELAGIWREVLGLDQIGIDDDFFACGGDSFTAMRVARRVGGGMRVVSLFQHPTVRRLADFLGQAGTAGYLHRLPAATTGTAAVTATVVAVPFGGATAAAYAELARALPPAFPLYAVELPGHDPADPHQPLEPFDTIAAGCADEIRRTITGPVVVYGHCVGAALAYDIAQRLDRQGVPVVGVVLGGAFPAPRLPGRIFDLWARLLPSDRWRSDRLYRDMLRGIGGLTEVLDPAEQAFTLRAVRHDARESEALYTRLCHTGTRRRSLHALSVVGERDRITEFHQERHREWDILCATTDLAVIPDAGHFFLRHQADQLAAALVGWTEHRLALPAPGTGSAAPDPGPAMTGSSGASPVAVAATPGPDPATPGPDAGGSAVARHRPGGRLRDFALVTLGQLVSLTGSRAMAFAMGVWVYLQTGSVTQFSVILIVALLPGLLVLPLAGAAADRWDRRLIMIAGEVTNAAGTGLCLIAYATGSLRLWHVCVAAALGSIASSFQQPAYLAAVAQLVPKQYLGRVNGILQTVMAVSQAGGPLVGGALIVAVGLRGVMVADLATVAVALATLLVVRFPDLLFRQREETVGKEIVGGLRYIARRPSLVAMVVFFLCYNLLLGVALALLPPLVLVTGGAGALSLTTVVGALGGVVGGLGMALWGGLARRATGMVGFVALTGAGLVVAGLGPQAAYPVVGMALVMASIALINGHWQTMIQIKVGMELQGRILATNRMTANLTEPLGYLGAGWLADTVLAPAGGADPGGAMAAALIVIGCAHVALALAGLRWRTLRYLEDVLPDAVPGAFVTWDRDALARQADARPSAVAGAETGRTLEEAR